MDWTGQEPVLRLRSILGPEPTNPWAALLPQLLLWCFRRFCIQHLTNLEENRLLDYLWDSHLELVTKYAPKGLAHIVHTWMTPDNISQMSSSSEDYNQFFVECIQALDEAIFNNNDALEDTIIDLLDSKIRTTIMEWLTGPSRAFFIFPMNEDQANVFTQAQFLSLVRVLLDYSSRKKPVAEPKFISSILPPSTASAPPAPTAPTAPTASIAPVVAPVEPPAAPSAPPAAAEPPTPIEATGSEELAKKPEEAAKAVETDTPEEAAETQEAENIEKPVLAAETVPAETIMPTAKQAVAHRRKTMRAHGHRGLRVTPMRGSTKSMHRYTRRASSKAMSS
jgi:hypothetical protein